MADDITTYLNLIKSASYGEEVRGAIHDAIEQCYEDGKTGAVDLVAREQLNTLIASFGGAISKTTLWSGTAYYDGQTIELSESPENFDYIEVVYRPARGTQYESRLYPSSEFANVGSIYISTAILPTEDNTSLNVRQLSLKAVANTGYLSYTLDRADMWNWTGVSSANATITSIPSSNETQQAGTISKIIGIKISDASAEVTDIRVGADGNTYQTAGSAVRTQIERVREDILELQGDEWQITDASDDGNVVLTNYFDANPTAVRVPDGSITYAKLDETVTDRIDMMITPEMFGAVGDGTTDDTTAFQSALDNGLPVLANGTYLVSSITVKNNTLKIQGTIKGQVIISNNAKVYGGKIQQTTNNSCVKFESTLNDHEGYMNSILCDCKLVPTSEGIGVELYSDNNALFGYTVRNVDIGSCDKSIYFYCNRWITKGDFDDVYCHTPNYAIYIDNITQTNTNCADMTFRNVYAQYYNHKPLNFFRCETGSFMANFENSFCYDGIENYYFYFTGTTSRVVMLGFLKNQIDSAKFTNQSNLRSFFFESTTGGEPIYKKFIDRKIPVLDYYGSAEFEAFSSAPAISKFFGIVGRAGSTFGGTSFTNKIFGISWYDGILSMFRSTDGTVSSGYSYKVTTPYSGGVYTTSTLPTTVTDGATCWCSDIKMPVTYYDGSWYKPDGTALT